jgi:integrase
MARKGENIYKRKDGRWEGRYIKGRAEDGRPRFGYVYGRRYGDVRAKLLPLRHLYRGIHEPSGYGGTFSQFAQAWLHEMAASAIRPLKPSTVSFYRTLLNTYLLPAFGERRLNSLTRGDISEFVESLMHRGMKTGSIRNIAGLLGRIMKAAASKGALPANPCGGIALPKRDVSPVRALRVREQQKIEQAAAQDKNGLAVLLALFTGMRIGEICALKWEDVDLAKGVVNVRGTLQRIASEGAGGKTQLVFGTPKSAYANRSIPLTPTLARRLETEMGGRPDGYVVTCRGGFAEPRTLRYRFAGILKAAGVGHVCFHSMRHTFATRCVETGMDVTTLSRLLGHSSVKMTLDIYTDSSPERREASVRKLDRLHARVPGAAAA